MKRKYIKRYINSQTGLADHVQVSEVPTHDHIEVIPGEQIRVAIPGEPPVPALKYEVEEIEVEENDDANMRARDYLEVLNKPKGKQDADTRWAEKNRMPMRAIQIPGKGKGKGK